MQQFLVGKGHCFTINIIIIVMTVLFIVEPALAQYGSIQKNDDSISRSRTSTPTEIKRVPNLSTGDKKEKQIQQQLGQADLMQSILGQSIQVHVLGDVEKPGVYTVAMSTRASELIQKADAKRNEVRLYEVRHPGEKTKYYDLYRYNFYGSLSQNPYLKDNDVVFVSKPRGVVRIEGPVKRVGLFELAGEKTLYDIIKLVGGFTTSLSKKQPLKVVRYQDNGNKIIYDVNHKKKDLKKFNIRNGDVIVVPDVINADRRFDYSIESIPGENLVYPTSVADVFIIGAVLTPGPYPYKSHLTVKDYVGFAGASADAHLRSVKILRDGKKKRYNIYSQVQSGDVIIVREKNLAVFMKYVSVVATIVSVTTSAIVLKSYIDRQ